MAITEEELDQFHRFACERISNGGAASLDALVAEWSSRREFDETVAELQRAVVDMENGIGRPFEEVDAEIRAKFGFSPRQDA